MLSSCPLAIWRKSYSSNLYPKYASETVCFFRAPNAKFSLPWEGGHPPPARSLCSFAVLLGGPLTRIFDPPPENFLVTGLEIIPPLLKTCLRHCLRIVDFYLVYTQLDSQICSLGLDYSVICKQIKVV